jgi:hypothetical protein
MPRMITLLAALILGMACKPVSAQTSMMPTAPQKMMPRSEAEKMRACERQAADQNIRMDLRSKFVMDCMTANK